MTRGGELDRALEVAAGAARKAGLSMLDRRAALGPADIAEKGPNDFVTAADKALERMIRDRIGEAFPADSFLGEEGGGSKEAAGRLWIVDPIDGTTNFIHRIPFTCVSIGLAVDGLMQIGVIYDPAHDELFSSLRGGGAWLNGGEIRVSCCAEIGRALIGTGFPSRFKESMEDYLRQFGAVSRSAAGVRRAGSAALDLAYVACGRFDGFWEPRLSAWDMAAGSLLVEAAGGIARAQDGEPWSLDARGIVAANERIFPDFSRLLGIRRP